VLHGARLHVLLDFNGKSPSPLNPLPPPLVDACQGGLRVIAWNCWLPAACLLSSMSRFAAAALVLPLHT